MRLMRLESRDCPALVAIAAPIDPFPGYAGPIDVAAAGDVVVVAAQTAPHVKVYVGGDERASFYAYDPAFTGGVNVATDGEHVATGTNVGAPHVREFTLDGTETRSYYAGDPLSLHGVRVAYDTPDRTSLAIRPEAPTQIYLDGASAEVVRGVAAIFEVFNVGITNVYPDQTAPKRIATVILGGSSDGPERGYAVVGGYFQQSEFTSYPARVYSDGLTVSQQIRAAAHEAAHLFGAVHSTDVTSVMFESLTFGGTTFDAVNFGILSKRLGRA